MKTECPNCEGVYPVDVLNISEKEIHVRCHECRVEYSLKRESRNGGQTREKKCPKCGHMAILIDETCSNCGPVFSINHAPQTREIVILKEPDKDNHPAGQVKKRINSIGWGSVIGWVVSICIVGIVFGSINLLDEKRAEPEIAFEIEKNIEAVRYDDARELVRNYYDTDTRKADHWFQLIKEREDINSYLQNGRGYFKEGVILSRSRDFTGAVEKFEEALKNFKRCNHQRSIAVTHLNLALCNRMLRRNLDSLAHFEDALDISREKGFEKFEAKALQGFGFVCNSLGQYERALTYLEKALAIHEDNDDKRGQALVWLMMGVVEEGQYTDRAENCFRHALTISREIGDTIIEAKATRLLNNRSNPADDDFQLSSS
jgi:predicted Zn finger-like uncharacterized protein